MSARDDAGPVGGPGFTIITGLSGAGRSEAAHSLEDLGFFVVDNLPPALLSKMAELTEPSTVPRPPMMKTLPPRDAAAACVVAAGSDPSLVTSRRPVSKRYTAREAEPSGNEPPATTREVPAAATAA